jgi:mRNA interferase HigB
VRIVKEKFLKAAAKEHPTATAWLELWRATVRRSAWSDINEVRKFYPAADLVPVKSKRVVTVFNVRGNHFRVVVAFHFKSQKVFTLRFMTHGAYDRNNWKSEL